MEGWEATQPWILSAVAAYFVLNFALTVWIWLVEGGQVFEGSTEKGEKVCHCYFWMGCVGAMAAVYCSSGTV